MMKELIDPDDGVVVQPRGNKHLFALFPILITVAILVGLWLWPQNDWDSSKVANVVRPPVAGPGAAVPETVLSVARSQPVGDEAYWDGFRLDLGWHLAPVGDYGRNNFVGTVTNLEDSPASAQLIITIRVADQNSETLLCKVSLAGKATGALKCGETNMAGPAYTSRWTRLTISAL